MFVHALFYILTNNLNVRFYYYSGSSASSLLRDVIG